MQNKDRIYRIIDMVKFRGEISVPFFMHQSDTGRPDLQDKEELIKFSDEIKEVLKQAKDTKDLYVPGNNPYKEYKVMPLVPEVRTKTLKDKALCLFPLGTFLKEGLGSVLFCFYREGLSKIWMEVIL